MSSKIIELLRYRLTQSLPGDKPRSLLAPSFNNERAHATSIPANAKKCAVLILLYVRNDKLQVVFELRNNNLHTHSGQISYPGGRIEGNETPIEAALRETYEEVGVPSHLIDVVGTLTPIYILPSNSYITPVVGYSDTFLDFKINKDEVEEVFTKPLDFFTFNNIKYRKWNTNGQELDIPYWSVHPAVSLWGATAMIMAEFVEIYHNLLMVR